MITDLSKIQVNRTSNCINLCKTCPSLFYQFSKYKHKYKYLYFEACTYACTVQVVHVAILVRILDEFWFPLISDCCSDSSLQCSTIILISYFCLFMCQKRIYSEFQFHFMLFVFVFLRTCRYVKTPVPFMC